MAATVSGVARSPSNACAGPPGRALIQRKTRIESPIRIGTRSRSRRTVKRSTYDVRRLELLRWLFLLDRHDRERLQRDGARLVALDAAVERERRLRVDIGDARQELHDRPVRLLVE